MKVISLILYMCSTVAQTCMPPYHWPTQFETSYDCMVAGYEEALRKTQDIGAKEINTHKIYIKFDCILVDPILPPPKPEEPPKSELTT